MKKFYNLGAWARINKTCLIANRKDPDLDLHCLYRPFWQVTTSV